MEEQRECNLLYKTQVSDLNTANFLPGNLRLWSYSTCYFEITNFKLRGGHILRGIVSLLILVNIHPKELHPTQLCDQ